MDLIKILCVFSLSIFIFLSCANEEDSSEFIEYELKTDLELPFNDNWYVVWGGRTIEQNYHSSLEDQRFAIDVVKLENGSTFQGNGSKNEDYYCYGDTLYAPASGSIVEMENSVLENIPGETNKDQLFGNYVIIDHGSKEYSVMAHFITNSIIVNKGENVSKNQMIGLCGNSGNSTEAHLHYHIQNSSNISNGKGLPSQFQNYFANDQFIERGEPIKGQTIHK